MSGIENGGWLLPESGDGRHSIRRIRRIARHIHASNYLEIGVHRGATFHGLQFERRVAVDPHFQFDPVDFAKAGVDFHEMTSDRYFTEIWDKRKFDIIFLDGLHTFEQTLRDFCNSLASSHQNSIWLVDDVRPRDVYSASRSHREAMELRKKANATSRGWSGDVFKLIFFIHDFFPCLSYVTLGNPGNPQTLVWHAPRSEFIPIFNNLSAIEHLTYADLVEREEVLNTKPEAEGLQMFFDAVAGNCR